MSGLNPFSLFLIINSLIIISLVLSQNEISKDSVTQNNTRTNPIEIILWISIILEIIILLITEKITDF
jgi:hypothetical protein